MYEYSLYLKQIVGYILSDTIDQAKRKRFWIKIGNLISYKYSLKLKRGYHIEDRKTMYALITIPS